MQYASYIVENQYGNFEPMLASVHSIPKSSDQALLPEAKAMTCIKLEDAQRFLKDHARDGAAMFLDPVRMTTKGITRLSQLIKAQGAK